MTKRCYSVSLFLIERTLAITSGGCFSTFLQKPRLHREFEGNLQFNPTLRLLPSSAVYIYIFIKTNVITLKREVQCGGGQAEVNHMEMLLVNLPERVEFH